MGADNLVAKDLNRALVAARMCPHTPVLDAAQLDDFVSVASSHGTFAQLVVPAADPPQCSDEFFCLIFGPIDRGRAFAISKARAQFLQPEISNSDSFEISGRCDRVRARLQIQKLFLINDALGQVPDSVRSRGQASEG